MTTRLASINKPRNIAKNCDNSKPSCPSSPLFPQAHHYLAARNRRDPSTQEEDDAPDESSNWQTEFGVCHAPRLRVSQGHLIHVETLDCFQGKVRPASTIVTPETLPLCRPVNEGTRDDTAHDEQNDNGSRNKDYNPYHALQNMTRDQFNPVTGPIFVEGAEPGDLLAVTLLDIRPKGIGVACCSPGAGQLSRLVARQHIQFFDLTRVDDCKDDDAPKDNQGDETSNKSNKGRPTVNKRPKLMVTMREDHDNSGIRENGDSKGLPNSSSLSLDCRVPPKIAPISFVASPMLGVIGVAPAGTDVISTMPAGKHGGNLDNQANCIGSTIYLTVNHPGALLSIGDMHAAQGDGEICGNGVEVAGDVLLTCQVLKQKDVYGSGCRTTELTRKEVDSAAVKCSKRQRRSQKSGTEPTTKEFAYILEYPVTETATHWITHGVVTENLAQTTVLACEEAAKLLVGQWGFAIEQAFCFLSVQGNLGWCQSCHPDRGTQIAKMAVPKLPSSPRPFRTQHAAFNCDSDS